MGQGGRPAAADRRPARETPTAPRGTDCPGPCRPLPPGRNRVHRRRGCSGRASREPVPAARRPFGRTRPRAAARRNNRPEAPDDGLGPTARPRDSRQGTRRIGKPVSSHFPAGFQPRKITLFPKLAPNSPPRAIFAPFPPAEHAFRHGQGADDPGATTGTRAVRGAGLRTPHWDSLRPFPHPRAGLDGSKARDQGRQTARDRPGPPRHLHALRQARPRP